MSYWDQSSGYTRSAEEAWEKLSRIAVSGAEYDSPERQPHPKCLDGTRVNFLDHLHESLDDPEKKRIIWVHGMAGVGKSAVAFTVAERMKRLKVKEQRPHEKRLAGTFFFSRKYTDRCTTGYFFATLAYQLACNFPSIKVDLNTAIHENPAILDPRKPLRDQMVVLFLRPLQRLRLRLSGCPPVVFIIDALDECTSEADIADLISLLGQALREPDLPVVHILLTSRSEVHIHEAIDEKEVRPLVCEILVKTSGKDVIALDGADVDSDICIFLKHSFAMLRSRCSNFPQPTEDELARLASRAGRRFIVASTMMKFIDDGHNDPRNRLQLMLELTSKLLPGTEVYKLYDHILSTCADPKRAYQHLSVVAALANPLPISQISELLGPGEGKDVETALVQLRSIMDIPPDSSLPVNIYHSSVRDYVSNPSNCGLFEEQCITPPHSLLAYASLCLMVHDVPESTGLLDALLQLKTQSQAMESHRPQGLRNSLAFIVEPPTPLRVLIALLWVRKMRSRRLHFWLESLDGRAWLRTQGGKYWLRTRGVWQWLTTQAGLGWLQSQNGRDWLQSHSGRDWLHSRNGRVWLLQSWSGGVWLQSPSGRDWLQSWNGRLWLRSWSGRDWLQSPSGRHWLQSPSGRHWLQLRKMSKWLQLWIMSDQLQLWSVRDWKCILRSLMSYSVTSSSNVHWPNFEQVLAVQSRLGWVDWVVSLVSLAWLVLLVLLVLLGWLGWLSWADCLGWMGWVGWVGWMGLVLWPELVWVAWVVFLGWVVWLGWIVWLCWIIWLDWPGSEELQGWKGWKGWLGWRAVLCWAGWLGWLANLARPNWLRILGWRRWLQTPDGQHWLRSLDGHEWLQWKGRDWLQTLIGREWLHSSGGREWLQTSGGREWLQTQSGQEWLQIQGGRGWLQTQDGREWLQTTQGQAWQSTPAASFWVYMEEFLDTVEAISKFKIVPESSLLPAFQAIQQFKTLPDFLMFPAFLILNPQSPTSSLAQDPEMEIIHTIKAFVSFTNEARERSQSASNALTYACQNWAMHLSRAPNPWDERLNHIFEVFWDHHLLSWLERQWCLDGLRSCLIVLSEGQKLAKEHFHTPKSSQSSV